MLTAPWCVISVSRDSGIHFRERRMVHDVQCVQRVLLPATRSSLCGSSVNKPLPAGPYCHHKASFSSWSPKGNEWAQTARAELGDCFALLTKQRNIWKKPSIPLPCRQKASPQAIMSQDAVSRYPLLSYARENSPEMKTGLESGTSPWLKSRGHCHMGASRERCTGRGSGRCEVLQVPPQVSLQLWGQLWSKWGRFSP